MDEHSLLVIMAVFVVVSAIALIFQACMLFGMYKSSRAMQQDVQRLTPKAEALMESSRVAIDDSRVQIAAVTIKANEVLDSARKQMVRIDELMSDATERTHRQLSHAELVVDDALGRAQKTVALVQGGVVKPIREISAVAAGLRAALHFLMRGNRPNPDQVAVDEEMFI